MFPARPGKDVYEPNGSVWVTRVKNAESEVMPPVPAVVGDVGDVIGASPLLQEMQTARPRNALRRRTIDGTLAPRCVRGLAWRASEAGRPPHGPR